MQLKLLTMGGRKVDHHKLVGMELGVWIIQRLATLTARPGDSGAMNADNAQRAVHRDHLLTLEQKYGYSGAQIEVLAQL